MWTKILYLFFFFLHCKSFIQRPINSSAFLSILKSLVTEVISHCNLSRILSTPTISRCACKKDKYKHFFSIKSWKYVFFNKSVVLTWNNYKHGKIIRPPVFIFLSKESSCNERCSYKQKQISLKMPTKQFKIEVTVREFWWR